MKGNGKQVSASPELTYSIQQYADWRRKQGLRGHSKSAVQATLKLGKIHRQCSEHEFCPSSCSAGRIPRDRADQEWAQYQEPEQPRSELADSRAARELWKSRMARVEYEERVGALVRADKVRAEQFRWARAIRDSVLGVSRRVAGRLAAETRPRAVQKILDEELEQALAQVPGPKGAKRTERA